MRRRRPGRAGLLLLTGGLIFCLAGAWIPVKAELAQILLALAWQESLDLGRPVRPWPWADIRPVARLRVPRLGRDMIVLSGQSGAALAFGPGMHEQGAGPGGQGTCILAGHRDTSFRFLRRLRRGDLVLLDDGRGRRWRYRVESTTVRRAEDLWFSRGPGAGLALVTCYPFDALRPGTRHRFVVLCRLDPATFRHRPARPERVR